ncbi:terpene synthase [Trichoderma citrinoviride]|uniref:Terpene synthase n=1 Tax=Trichoderma citrinoviride TaxID=58853 RepID=A0A2T4B539_9HYPO|nr:terpene synthase [Trichoderma citrinoviride]PTB64420.1 terpene synthase [Trichoderma citrinoviride]
MPFISSQAIFTAALQGQSFRFSGISTLLRAWQHKGFNALYEDADSLATSTILRVDAAAPHMEFGRFVDDRIAALTCLCFPNAPKPQLEALVLFVLWNAYWSGTYDTDEGDLSADFDAAHEWRLKTMRTATRAIRANRDELRHEVDAINSVFFAFGDRYCELEPLTCRSIVLHEIYERIRAYATEQRMKLNETQPGFDEYMELRNRTMNAGALCLLVPFAMAREVPFQISCSWHEVALRKQVKVLLCLLDDPLILAAQLHYEECVLNAVCTLLGPETPLDAVIAQIDQKIQDAIRLFEEAGEKLMDDFKDNEDLYSMARDLVDGYRNIVTGTVVFK